MVAESALAPTRPAAASRWPPADAVLAHSGILDDGMTRPDDERPGRRTGPDAAEFARRERELEQFRANIERLRRERQAALDEFGSLTRNKGEPAPASPVSAPPSEDLAPPPEPDVLVRSDTSIPSALPAGDLDRLTSPVADGDSAGGGAVDLSEDDAPAAPLPDDALDFAALTEEDTIIDSAPRRAADRRRTMIFSLLGAGAVGMLAWMLWGPWSQGRSEAPLLQPPVSVLPEPPSGTTQDAAVDGAVDGPVDTPLAAPARRLVVRVITSRPVWMRAMVDGRPSWNRLVPAGETLTLEADASVTLRVGDAGAVRVMVNGRDRGPAGRDGQVVTASFGAGEQ